MTPTNNNTKRSFFQVLLNMTLRGCQLTIVILHVFYVAWWVFVRQGDSIGILWLFALGAFSFACLLDLCREIKKNLDS